MASYYLLNYVKELDNPKNCSTFGLTNSILMKLLVCPDTHGRNIVDALLKSKDYQTAEHIICLGDYVDSWELTDNTIYENLYKLIELAQTDKRITLLIGNHDAQYIWPNETKCSGYRKTMLYPLNTLFNENINLFKFAETIYHKHVMHLFTHAGVTNDWHNYLQSQIKLIYGDTLLDETLEDVLNLGTQHPKIRKLLLADNGVVWASKTELENFPYPDYNQYVGHTNLKAPVRISVVNNFIGTSFLNFLDTNKSLNENYLLHTIEI